MEIQLGDYFNSVYHPYLCAFRRGHGCQTILLKLIEDWRTAQDKIIILQQSLWIYLRHLTAFAMKFCLTNCQHMVFCHIQSLSSSLISQNRKQQIKINNVLSSWADIHKGVPQGSIMEPLLFNVFINDIFSVVKHGSLYNYADDNTLSFCSPHYDNLITAMQTDSIQLIEWFNVNKMQANPEKFQVLAAGNKTY
jgi:hypothetical protein